ncbi:MAG: DMT family transporter [Ancrocorticia sp.]
MDTTTRTLTGPFLIAILAGVFVSIQGIFNGAFTASGAGPLLAGWVSYLGTLVTVVVIIVAQGNAAKFLGILRERGKPWWFAVGAGGVPIVIAMAWGIPLVGATIASVCAVAGQTIMGLMLDRFGLGLPEKIRLSGFRIGAVAVVLTGLGLAISAGADVSGVSSGWAMLGVGLLLFFACSFITFQNSGNGAVVSRAGYPLLATFTSVVGGTTIMSVIVLAMLFSGGLEGHSFPGVGDWWMYLGGPAGAGITICAATSVRRLGTFRLALAMVSGQMTTALIVDFFSHVPVSPATVISAATVVLATILASMKPGTRGAESA